MGIDEIILILHAYKQGYWIEYRAVDSHSLKWRVMDKYFPFNFNDFEYRIRDNVAARFDICNEHGEQSVIYKTGTKCPLCNIEKYYKHLEDQFTDACNYIDAISGEYS